MNMTVQIAFDFERAPIANASRDAVPAFMQIIERFNVAVLAGNQLAVLTIEQEAIDFASALNGGTWFGIMADENSPCCILERSTASPRGRVPIWGQVGTFDIEIDGIPVRIEKDGIYGIGGCGSFSANRVDLEKQFPISDTGYRSFLGRELAPSPMTVDTYVVAVVRQHLQEIEKQPKRRKIRNREQAVSA